MAIVIIGNIAEGATFHGPFTDLESAVEWATVNVKHDAWTVAPLESVEE